MYITETPDAGVVCFVFIVWKLDLIVACAVWRIRLLLYMHVEKLNFVVCSLSMHISKRNVTKGGCNRVDNTHASTTFYLRPVAHNRCDCTRCIPSSNFYLETTGSYNLAWHMASFRCGVTFRLAPNSLVITLIFKI